MKLRGPVGLLLLLVIGGCPQEERAPPPTEDVGPTLAATSVDATIAAPATSTSAAERAESCDVPWIGMKPCRADEHVYATGAAGASSMSAQQAAGSARATLARLIRPEGGEVTLEQVELINTVECQEKKHVLARMPRAEIEVPECDAQTIGARAAAPAGCPDWVSTIIMKDGDTTISVAEARGIRNPSLAKTTAANRARAQLIQLDKVTVTLSPNGASSSSGGASTVSGGEVEYAECAGATWAKLSVR